MAKFQSPLLGYNNNVRHKGRVFHIQTEDSGVNHPHIITHLFMDGGRILKSVKRSYAEHVGSENMSETVRGLMKEQHKAMFIALRDGQFDELVDGAVSPAAKAAAAARKQSSERPAAPEASEALPKAAAEAHIEPPVPTSPEPPRMEAAGVAEPSAPTPSAGPPRSDGEPAPATVEERRRSDDAAAASGRRTSSGRLVIVAEEDVDDELEEEPMTTREPADAPAAAAAPPSVQELTLDFDALERASNEGSSSLFRASDLPPPPKNLFAKEPGTGTYRAFDSSSRRDSTRVPPSRPQPRTETDPRARPAAASPRGVSRPTTDPPAQRPSSEGRYAPARPAAIFGASAKPPASSIFSDDLVSDKSLDEVILSYLAEDLEPPRRK